MPNNPSQEAREAVIAKFIANGMDPDVARRMVEGWSADNPTLVMLARFEALIRADAYEQAAKWQPIETLPEFTDALVCVTYNVPEDEDDKRPRTDVEGYVWETAQWVDWYSRATGWFVWPQLVHIPFQPTHWLPLPNPPSEQPAKTRQDQGDD